MIHIPKKHQPFIESISIFILSTALFMCCIADQEVVGFESRFYLFALEMWRHGFSWFPSTYLQPYPDYPGLSTWLIVLFSKLDGGLDKFSAVLPTAMTAGMVVVMTYQIGALQCKRWGLYAASLLLFTLGFIKNARSISLDMYITLLTAICFYLMYSAEVFRQPKRVYWVFLCLLVGFLFRGPIGLVMPAGVVFTYLLVQKNYKDLAYFSVAAAALLGLCIAGLLLLAYFVGGEHFANDVWRMQVLGRMGSSGIPIYYYFLESFFGYAITYPIAVFVLIGLLTKNYRRSPHTTQQQFLFQVAGWVGVIILGMSLPGDKKLRYILPLVPALALLAAYPISSRQTEKYFVWLRRVVLSVLFCLPALLAATLFYLDYAHLYHEYLKEVPQVAMRNSLLVMQLLAIGSLHSHDIMRRVSIIFATALISFLLVYIYIVEPVNLDVEGSREVVQAVEQIRLKNKARMAFYRLGEDGLPIKYVINMTDEEKPIFLQTSDELFAYKAPAVVLTTSQNFNELVRNRAAMFDVLLKGKMGHVDIVVFRSKRLNGK